MGEGLGKVSTEVMIFTIVLLLIPVIGEIILLRKLNNSGDKRPSSKYLGLFVYNILIGLPMLLFGINGLEQLSDFEEVMSRLLSGVSIEDGEFFYSSLKYTGIIWLVVGGIDGVIAIMQKLNEISEAEARRNRSQNRNGTSVPGKVAPKDVIPAWEWAEQQKKKEEDAIEGFDEIEEFDEAEELEETEVPKSGNIYCVYCGDRLDDDQLFCGKCGKKRK